MQDVPGATGSADAGVVAGPLLGSLASRPRMAAATGAACIAFSGIIFRVSGVGPTTATFFRCLLALPLLWLLARAEDRRFGPRAGRERWLGVGAGLFFAADLECFHTAVTLVGAGLGTVLPNLQVIAVAIATWLIFGERPPTRAVAAVPVVLGGVVLISGVLEVGAYGRDPVGGAVLGVAAGVFYAGFLVLIRRIARDRRRAAGPLLDATFTTAVVALPIGLAVGGLDLAPGWVAIGWLALLALSSQVLGYLFITLSLPRLPAIVSSLLLFVQPVATMVLAALLLAERPSPLQLFGVALVLGGVVLAAVPVGRFSGAVRRAA
jgi:drug/metabolite transporter (DMT)-like permease